MARRWVASAGVAALLAGMFPFAAHAAPEVSFSLAIHQDGTEAWDANDDPGNDSGANNGIVRVNDTVVYEMVYGSGDEQATKPTFTLTLPKGMWVDDLPGYCGAGSSRSPETLPGMTFPLTATSVDSLPEQTVTCRLADLNANQTSRVLFPVRVLNLVRHGQTLTPVAAKLSADGAEAAAASLPSVTTSSRLKWDISKNSTALRENSGYRYGPANSPCPWDTTKPCKEIGYQALISAPAGGKGAMPAIGDITFVDDLSPEAMYPGLTAGQHAAMKANLDRYGSRITLSPLNYQAPGSKIGIREQGIQLTATNSVRDSGATTVAQPGGPGTPVTFTIKGADTTLITYPTMAARPAGYALPGTNAYAVAIGFTVWTPVATITDFGVESNSTWTLNTRNAYTDFNVKGFEASDVQTSAGQPAWNDYRTTAPNVSVGNEFTKGFTGVPGQDGNQTNVEFTPSDPATGEGPAGGATYRSGAITVVPGQDVLSQMLMVGSNPALPAPVSYVACDAWDNTRLHLRRASVPASQTSAWRQHIPSGGEAVWVSGYNNLLRNGQAVTATSASQVPAIQVQYSATPGAAGTASTCGDDQGPWYDDPADVPGNDAALAADGIYTGVARVRVSGVLPAPVANNALVSFGVRAAISVNLRVADSGRDAGDVLPNWASHKRVNFAEETRDAVLAHPGRWTASNYAPQTHAGAVGDRLILGYGQARIAKQVRKSSSGEFSSTPPQVTGGDVVQYRLSPSLASPTGAGSRKDLWVEDCLPASQSYSEATVEPTVVSVGSTPADAKRAACAAGETYLRWEWPGHQTNTAIEPVIVTVEVSAGAADGVYTNTAVVWADGDASTLAERSAEAQVQITNPAEMRLEKVALTPTTQVNREGQATNEVNRWRVRLSNLVPPTTSLSNPDVIDVLPRQGTNNTSFKGRFEFVRAELTSGNIAAAGQETRLLYTSAADVDMDPRHATNAANGSTAWCDAPAGGTVVVGTGNCPREAGDVTAVRVQRSGEYRLGDVIEFDIAMEGVGNASGDVYVNSAFARADGLRLPVGPIRRAEQVRSATIGDHAWIDINRNGIQDGSEPPASGVEVRLTGTDDLGNDVSLSTTTGSDGGYRFEGLRASDESGYTVTFGEFANGFTKKGGGDVNKDSDADPATGSAAPVVLRAGGEDASVDAGYVAAGSLKVTKALEGPGASLANGDRYRFSVTCTMGDETVVDKEVTLTIAGGKAGTTEAIGDIPVGSRCVVEETEAGGADPVAQAPSATVTIGLDPRTGRGEEATATLANRYSAGVLRIAKKLEGDDDAVAAARSSTFVFSVICQRPVAGGQPVTVYSGDVSVIGAETVTVTDAAGDPLKLPLGTRCWANETDDGGAESSVVDHDSYDNAAVVETAPADELAELTITATNTFHNPAPSPTQSPEPSPTPEPEPSPTPSVSFTPDPSPTQSPAPTPTPGPASTPSVSPGQIPSPLPSQPPSSTPTQAPALSPSPGGETPRRPGLPRTGGDPVDPWASAILVVLAAIAIRVYRRRWR